MRSTTSLAFAVAAALLLGSSAGATPATLEAGDYTLDLAASRDGRWLAAAPAKLAPVLFYVGPAPEAGEGEGSEPAAPPPERRELASPPASIDALTFTPDSQFLVVEPDLEDTAAKLLVFATATAELVFEIDCAAAGEGRSVGPKHVWAVRPGPAGSQFYVVRSDALALWDAAAKEPVWQDKEFSATEFFLARDGSAAVAAARGRILVLDPADRSERVSIADEASRGQLKPSKKKNQIVLGLNMSPVGVSPDGGVVVTVCTQEKVMDQNKLANPSADPEDRLKAIKHFGWLEGFDAATGASSWVADLPERVYSSDVRCVGERVCVEVNGNLRLFDVRSGKSKGKISASAEITAQASADGETWWYADEKGHIRSK